MSYVPIVTPTPTPPPTPRTRELAGLLAKVLDEYTKAHPAVTNAEVRAAIRLAQASAGPDQTRITAVLSMTVGLVIAGLGLGFFYFRSTGGGDFGPILPLIIAVLVVLVGVAMLVVKAQSR